MLADLDLGMPKKFPTVLYSPDERVLFIRPKVMHVTC